MDAKLEKPNITRGDFRWTNGRMMDAGINTFPSPPVGLICTYWYALLTPDDRFMCDGKETQSFYAGEPYVREIQLHTEVLVREIRWIDGAELEHMLHIKLFVGWPIMRVHLEGRVFHSRGADG